MKSKVALIKVKPKATESEIAGAVNRALDLIGGVKGYCSKGGTILVKPNFTNDVSQGTPSWRTSYYLSGVYTMTNQKSINRRCSDR